MRTTIHAILLAFVLPFCQEVVAQIPQAHPPRKPVPQVSLTQFIHRKWETEQGLPQNSAISITQTRDGYVWFGTTDGLVRFDGVRFEIFSQNSTPALSHNWVSSVREARNGALWVTTFGGGVNVLHNGKNHITLKENGLLHNSARKTLQTSDGAMLIGTNEGINIMQNGKISVLSERLRNAVVTELLQDPSGVIWIGTRNMGLFTLQNGVLTEFPLPTVQKAPSKAGSPKERQAPVKSVMALVRTSNGAVWVGTTEGLFLIHKAQLSSFSTEQGLPHNAIQALTLDRDGNVWVGTQSGLCLMNADGVHLFGENHPLKKASIASLFLDRENMLWVGTASDGLHRLHEGIISVFPEALGKEHESALSVAEASNGAIFFGTTQGAFVYSSTEKTTAQHIPASKDVVYSLLPEKENGIWLGTVNGVQYLAFPQNKPQTVKTLTKSRIQSIVAPSTVVLSLAKDSADRLWIGTQNKGLICAKNGIITPFPGMEILQREIISTLYTARDGTLWIGTWNGGAWFLRDGQCKRLTEREGMRHLQILSFLEDAEGTVWIGTFGGGIHRFKNGVAKHLTLADGLGNDIAYALLEDNRGYIWASFNKGIFRVLLSEMNACLDGKLPRVHAEVFDTEDGMRSSETNGGTQPVGWRCKDGRLLFATIRGIAELQPNSIQETRKPPTVIIETLQADSSKIAINVGMNEALTLPSAMQRFECAYTATSLGKPANVRFRYLLEGYDAAWIEAGTRRTAYYTNLPRGRTYRFRVLACNEKGVWNEEGASVKISVQPFFWETWWAVSIYAACGVSGLWQIFRFREQLQRRRLREKFREREAELIFEKNQVLEEANTRLASLNGQLSEANEHLVQLNEEKVDILGVVAHDLKNPIIGIQKMAYSLEGQAKRLESPQMLESASIIKRTSERMFAMIQQLLKVHAAEYGKESLIPTRINVNELCEQLRHDWEHRAKLRSVEIRTVFPDEPVTAFADPMAVLQVVENLLSNAIKASHLNSRVELHCRMESDKAVIVVKDFGIGMNEEQQQLLFTKYILLRGAAKAGLPTEEYSSGLGLYIVKKLVDAMNGEIRCESALHQGSTFTLFLPQS